jgi:hypothetical protein
MILLKCYVSNGSQQNKKVGPKNDIHPFISEDIITIICFTHVGSDPIH